MPTYCTSNINHYTCGRQAKCCRGWDILFSRDIISRIEADKEAFPVLKDYPEFYQVVNPGESIHYAGVTIVDGHCLFLNEDNSCQLFNHFGKSAGNPVCLSYPFTRMELPGRHAVSSALSCASEQARLFQDDVVFIMQVATHVEHEKLHCLDFSKLESVLFLADKNISWNIYFQLEEQIINTLGRQKNIWNVIRIVCGLYETLLKTDKPILMADALNINLDSILATNCPGSKQAFQKLSFFIKRKINLYNNQLFKDAVKSLLALESYFMEGGCLTQDFREEFQKFEPAVCKYLAIKLFSNTAIFQNSLAFCLHTLLLYISFIEAYCFASWRESQMLDQGSVSLAINLVERHFFHDAALFTFWGKGVRGAADFDENSLQSLVLCR